MLPNHLAAQCGCRLGRQTARRRAPALAREKEASCVFAGKLAHGVNYRLMPTCRTALRAVMLDYCELVFCILSSFFYKHAGQESWNHLARELGYTMDRNVSGAQRIGYAGDCFWCTNMAARRARLGKGLRLMSTYKKMQVGTLVRPSACQQFQPHAKIFSKGREL